MNCFHLTDWLKHSDIFLDKKILDEFVRNHDEMQICKYLCFGSKHLKLDNNRHDISNTVTIGREYDYFEQITKQKTLHPVKNINYILDVKYGQFDVFTLSDKCVELWEQFLKQNHLI